MSGFYENFVLPVMFRLEPEAAHEIGIRSLQIGLGTEFAQQIAERKYASNGLPEIEMFGLKFKSPIGVAAGFDKNGIVVNQLAALGFGFVEVGTVTFRPQAGNEKPRLFRLPADGALINRLGFNNEGAVAIANRLAGIERRCIVGVNIGKNKDVPNEEAAENYLRCFEIIHPVAGYVAVNISSPNTPNLRELQKRDNLEHLLSTLCKRNTELGAKPILVKIAPDLDEMDIEMIVGVAIENGVSGIIATNTTLSRAGLKTPEAELPGSGGLSGRPLERLSNGVISAVYRYSGGKLPIVGVGGIFTAGDAFEKIAAGASLLQAYTGFVFQGPSFASRLNEGLDAIIRRKGFTNIDEAVGCESRDSFGSQPARLTPRNQPL